jgi:hypothetical protein
VADGETSGAGPEVVPPDVTVGIVAAPALPDGLAGDCARDLRGELGTRHPEVHWHFRLVHDALVAPPAGDGELVAAARRRLLDGDWDLAIVLTDLPLGAALRPVVAHASPLHGVAVLSVPALGTVALRHRAREALLRLVGVLLGEARDAGPGARAARARSARITRRLRELASEVDEQAQAVVFTTRVLTGHLGLLLGMVRANRPWQLARGLSRALVAAGAAGAFALVTPDLWRIADVLGWQRLGAVTVLSVTALTVTLVLGAQLWERADRRGVRQQVVLFNLATSATVLTGVVALYAALFGLSLLAALLLVVPRLLAEELAHPVALRDYLDVAWLTSSLATVGGALGAGLESDEAVRRAAYTYRTSTATESEAAGRPGIGTSTDVALGPLEPGMEEVGADGRDGQETARDQDR